MVFSFADFKKNKLILFMYLKIKFKNLWRKKSPIFKWQISGNFPKKPLVRPIDPWKGSLKRGEKSFLSHPKFISESYWNSFEWLRDLKELQSEKSGVKSRELIREWHENNNDWDEIVWSPVMISKRLSNILFCYGNFADSADPNFQEELMKNFATQARCLELDFQGKINPRDILYTLVGKMASRVCLSKESRDIDEVISEVIIEIKKVINEDGMHFSRKPQLQLEVLRIIIEIQYLGRSKSEKTRKEYNEIVQKVASCSKMLQHPNGSIVNINGGCNLEKEFISQIIEKSGSSIKSFSGITKDGFAKLSQKSTSMIIDLGSPIKTAKNWHAGTFSFELCHGKNLIIVNSGFLDIDTTWSNALRGTSAHSTLSIDGKNSSSLDEGKNPKRIAKVIQKSYEKTNEGLKVSATHNGYYLGYGIYHTRELLVSKDGDKISGNDELKYQGAPGNIPLLADIRFHLCSDLKAAQVLSGDILLRLKNKTGWIFKVKNLIPKLKESIFIKDGDIMKTEQIVFSLPLGDLRSRGTKTLQWELYKSL